MTDERTELDENSKSILNEKLQLVLERGSVYERVIVLEDGNRIPMDQILDLDSGLFQSVLFE